MHHIYDLLIKNWGGVGFWEDRDYGDYGDYGDFGDDGDYYP